MSDKQHNGNMGRNLSVLSRRTVMLMMSSAALATFAGAGSAAADAVSAINTNPDGKGKTLRLWHYEEANSALTTSWNAAIEVFERETGAKVEYESKSFDQMRQSSSQVLNSNSAPDIMEVTKGNAVVGLLSNQGLLTQLNHVVEAYGWDKTVTGGLQTTLRYQKGLMGSGDFYGMSDTAEFMQVYYNKDVFSKLGVAVPTSFEELESVMEAFKAQGITPLAVGGGNSVMQQVFYQLALVKADRAWVDAYQFFKGNVDWHGPELTFAATTLKDWVDKGFVTKDSSALTDQDVYGLFVSEKSPMFYTGTWNQGPFRKDVKFDWGFFLFPSKMGIASGGRQWVVPENSKNKELAYKFIDITLRPAMQNILGNAGGIPVNADLATISDQKTRDMIENFKTLNDRDGLAMFEDNPYPLLYDQLTAALQELVNGSKSPAETLDILGTQYQQGVDEVKSGE